MTRTKAKNKGVAKMGRPPKGSLPPIHLILQHWRNAWLASDGCSPYGLAIDKALMKYSISTYDIKVAIGCILAKPKDTVTADEYELIEFSEKVRYLKEQALTEKVSNSPVGQIFLLKSQYGYKDQAIDVTLKPVELIPEFGVN